MRNTRNYLDVHSVVDGPYAPPTPPTPPTPPDPVTYTVTLPEEKYCTAAFVAGSSSPAVAGSTVNFTVAATEGYEITSVHDGAHIFTDVNGVYTINAIAADTTIFVEAALIPAPVTYTVTLPKNPNYIAEFVAGSSGNAVAGSVVNFTVVADEGYEIIQVNDDRKHTLTPVNGVYTINGIVANTTISVVATLIAPVTYTVSLPFSTRFTAAFVAGSSSPAVAGSDVYFTIIPAEGYEITQVDDGINAYTEEYGVYTISAIAADTEIEAVTTPVIPPTPVTYEVILPADTSYTAAFVAGSSSPAEAGSTVNFTVVAADGYAITSVTDGTYTLNAVNGVYTINGIAADTTIAVEAALTTPVAGFTYEADAVDPLTIEFTNTSTDAVSCYWNFGDGAGSASENPTHTYAAAGSYTVELTVWGVTDIPDTETKNITV